MSFINKVALVTGASSGIGAAIAIKFSEEGAKVVIVGRNHEKLKNVAEKCKEPLIVLGDVSKEDDCKRIVDETINNFGRLDVLINNAATLQPVPTTIKADNALHVFDEVMATNLRSVVCLTNLAARHLSQTKGNIINISGIGSLRVLMTNFSHNTSKAGMDHFTRTVALDLAKDGIRVNVVNPGAVKTDVLINAGYSKEEQDALWEMLKESSALKRISEPDEIADLVLFIASDKAKGITGSSFVSDNGQLLTGGF